MHKWKFWYAVSLAIVIGLTAVAPMLAQEEKHEDKQENKSEAPGPLKAASVYRLEFVFSELQDNKIVNSRAYEMLSQAGQLNKIRAGARMPVLTGEAALFQYVDIGMNIDYRVEEREGGIGLKITADSSSLSYPETDKGTAAPGHPIVQQFRSQVDTIVSPGKPTIVSRMDDPSSKRRFQLEVTASKAR